IPACSSSIWPSWGSYSKDFEQVLRAANKTSDLALHRLASAVKLIVVSRSEEEVHDLATDHESFLRCTSDGQAKSITVRQNQAVGIRPGRKKKALT
ncbi:hypothetical protein J1C51_20905, partial [Chromobacterium haemolyticum]